MPKKRKSSESLCLDLKQNDQRARRDVANVQSYFDQETYGRHTALSKATGIPYQTLRRALGNVESLRLHHLMLLARAMKEEPDSLLKKALEDLVEDADKIDPNDPALKLREAHDQQVPVDEFFVDSVRFFKDLSPIKLPRSLDNYVDSEVEAIDELREQDRAKALERAQKSLAIGSDFRDATQFAGYIGRLGALATIHRVYGRYYLAALILERAMRLLRGRYESVLAANLLIRAASVLRDLSRPKDGIPLLRWAQSLMDEHGRTEEATAALYLRATFFEYTGDRQRALSALNACSSLPASDLVASSAQLFHAYIEIQRKKLTSARAILSSLELRCRSTPQLSARVAWRFAVCAGVESPMSEESLQRFQNAIASAREHLEPADLFFVFFDFAEMLSKAGEFCRLASEASRIAPDLTRLGEGTHAFLIARDFLRCAATATMFSVAEVRREFHRACKRDDSASS